MLDYVSMKNKQYTKQKNVNKKVTTDADDVVFEAETDVDMVGGKSSFGSGGKEDQIKKLKKKLKEAEQRAKENLDGWQRLKADMANKNSNDAKRLTDAKEKGKKSLLESLLPALDSFDSAMQGDAWNAVDDAWRMGMEFVHTQLMQALEDNGVKSFGAVGDEFDTSKYEAAEGDGEKVIKVLRKGYLLGTKVIRPARVIVGN